MPLDLKPKKPPYYTETENVVKKYSAIINQSGSDAPVATVLENTLGGTLVWTRDSAGYYVGTLSGAFETAKTQFYITPCDLGFQYLAGVNIAPDSVFINTYTLAGVAADGRLNNAPITIIVFP